MGKTFQPHIILVEQEGKLFVSEESYKEDAEARYEEYVQKHASKVVLAKVIRAHGEG
jgi:hypothetical protein